MEQVSAALLCAAAPGVRELCGQTNVGVQQEPCRQTTVGIQGKCSALHPLCPALKPCALCFSLTQTLCAAGLWPGDCKRKQNPDTWQSTCQISQSASTEWKETPLQRSLGFNIFMDCHCNKLYIHCFTIFSFYC